MNPARSLGAALVLNDWTSWWAYLAVPAVGGAIAVGIAYGLRGPGGGLSGTQTAGAHRPQGDTGRLPDAHCQEREPVHGDKHPLAGR